MKILLIIAVIALIIITTKYILYRRQIKNICRQLAFLSENMTNYRIRTEVTEKEIIMLANQINEMNDRQAKREVYLQNKDRRLRETLTSVSHDIRTPLTSLKGYFALLMSEDNAESQLKYASVMHERMDNLTALLDELFTYTKLQNEDYKLELEEHDFTKLVLDTIFSFYESFKAKNIEPEFDIDDKSYKVVCNDVAVKRVISNIIRNAVLHGNGDIKVEYKKVNLDDTNSDAESGIRFICSNSIDKPDDVDVEQIFDRFYKADKARSDSSTGLGLAIAKELVERMGGSIGAEIENNTFFVYITFNLKKS